MSKQKSKQAELRFSGPELSVLLDEVVSEHGSTAAISAVNRIRSGGFAGFFCREEFEVVVDSSGKRDRPAEPALTETPSPPQVERPAADPMPPPTPPVAPRPEPAIEPAVEPVVARAPARARGPETFAGPQPVSSTGPDDRFLALLERRLDAAAATEASLAERSTRRPRPEPELDVAAPQPNLQPVGPAPSVASSGFVGAATTVAPGVVSDAPLTTTTGTTVIGRAVAPTAAAAPTGFWLRLQRAQHELASFMPLASTFVAVVGPLSLTTPIATRLRAQPDLASADVVVLTDRAEIVSEPTWRLVRSGHQLVEAARGRTDWPTLLLIDVPVELPHWVPPLQNRLRMAGVGLFRYAVTGTPTPHQLEAYRLGSDVPYVLDLVSRVQPERVIEFLAHRHPIASVAGAGLSAELLVAMREQVGIGQ